MIFWYQKITEDMGNLSDALVFFDEELENARKEISVKGRIDINSSRLPGMVEHRFNQLQELEAILEYLNIRLKQLRKTHFKNYMETYARQLSSRDAEKYVDGEDEVVNFTILVNEVALRRNRYLGVIKALDISNWQLSNITRLRVAGLDDASI